MTLSGQRHALGALSHKEGALGTVLENCVYLSAPYSAVRIPIGPYVLIVLVKRCDSVPSDRCSVVIIASLPSSVAGAY